MTSDTQRSHPSRGRQLFASRCAALSHFWLRLLWALPLGMVILSAGDPVTDPYDEGEDASPATAKMSPGEKAARTACTMCHAFPTPDMLDQKCWREQILPRMKVRLGLAIPDYASSPDGELIKQRKLYTEKPMIPYEWWGMIEEYFLTNAPAAALPQDPRPPIAIGLSGFRTEKPLFRTPTPTTTLVKISPSTHRIFVGDERTQSLFILDAKGALLHEVRIGNVPVDATETDLGLYLVCVGSFLPTERYCAAMFFLPKQGDSFGPPKPILTNLPRSTQAVFADFNGDGKMDFALCMFGNLTGRFSWFENLGNDQYREHVLSTKAGAVRCVAHDFNGDGKPDLAVLMTQELEMFIIMLNDGKGNFSGDMIFQRPPVWGHNYFELADFNRNGRPDLVVVNGDNGEYESPLKKYHGVRIYKNQGGNQYQEAFFYPLDGAYKAVACDFTGRGKLDVAAISYFPDYKDQPRESFVLLENQGNSKFNAFTFRECIAGRWLVMDVGDLLGDGHPDIVLGSHIIGPSPVPDFLMNVWKQYSPSVQILRNNLNKPAPPSEAPPDSGH